MPLIRCCLLVVGCFFAGCFSLDEPLCSFQCGAGGACPDDYACMADGYCHKIGTSGSCLYSDASVPPDLTAEAADLSTPADLSVPDMTMAPDLPPASDLSSLPDLGNMDM